MRKKEAQVCTCTHTYLFLLASAQSPSPGLTFLHKFKFTTFIPRHVYGLTFFLQVLWDLHSDSRVTLETLDMGILVIPERG